MSTASDRPSDRVEFARGLPAGLQPNDNGSLPPQSSFGRSHRASDAYVVGLTSELTVRDQAILRDLRLTRCLTGRQLERLHFHDLGAANRDRARRRVLNRLIRLSVVATLSRRVGGVRAGSAGLVYALDAAGQRVLRLLDEDGKPARRPWTPSPLFLAHTLAVAELYVSLREAERAGYVELPVFLAEPACWQRTISLGTIKPDAHALLASKDIEDAWWIEVDQGTESSTTLRRKFSLYLLAAQAGVTGPDGILPRVLVTVKDEHRLDMIRGIIDGLDANSQRLFSVVLHRNAIAFMVKVLQT